MNEQEWVASVDPARMLEFVTENPDHANINCVRSPRKLRLWACAVCRQAWDGAECEECLGYGFTREDCGGPGAERVRCADCRGTGRVGDLSDPRSRRAVEVAERYADEGEVVARKMGREWLYLDTESPHEPMWILAYLCCLPPDTLARELVEHAEAVSRLVPPATQAALLRDIFGDPFRAAEYLWKDSPFQARPRTLYRLASREMVPQKVGEPFPKEQWVAMDWLRWNDGTVPRIARGIYEDRRWGDLPILGDALLDSGCDDDGLIGHCRDAGPHACGCAVVDLILGKETAP